MKSRLYLIACKALCLMLMTSIIAVGAFAVHLTHVNASITITFGQPQDSQLMLASAMQDSGVLNPLPLTKRKGQK